MSNSTAGSVFTLTSGTLFIDRNPSDDIFPPPNAVIEFDETATGCGPTGPLMITRFASDTCAVSGFSFSGDVLEADVAGTFEVCGSQVGASQDILRLLDAEGCLHSCSIPLVLVHLTALQ